MLFKKLLEASRGHPQELGECLKLSARPRRGHTRSSDGSGPVPPGRRAERRPPSYLNHRLPEGTAAAPGLSPVPGRVLSTEMGHIQTLPRDLGSLPAEPREQPEGAQCPGSCPLGEGLGGTFTRSPFTLDAWEEGTQHRRPGRRPGRDGQLPAVSQPEKPGPSEAEKRPLSCQRAAPSPAPLPSR